MKTLLQDCLKFFNGRDNTVSANLKSYDLAVRVEAALTDRDSAARPVGALSTVWDALHDWEDGLFLDDEDSNSFLRAERQEQCDEVKTAMALIHEALGVSHEEI